jgi:outer membrane PBP1 activator LpoA protein
MELYMKPLISRGRRAATATLLAFLLYGCETVPRPAPSAPPASAATAEQAERRGEYLLAAREYERLARSVKPPQRQSFQLRGIEALLRAGQAPEARQKLAQLKIAGLEPAFGVRKRVLEAKLLVLEGAHVKALRQLEDIARLRPLDPTLLADIERTRAQAELAVGNPVGAVTNLIRRERYLADKEAVADNQQQIWKILRGLSRVRLAAELNLTRDPVLSGWIELALAVTENAGAIESWKQAHPGHPASEPLLATLRAGAPAPAVTRPRTIALLLPLSSSVALAAQAVHDGFLAIEAANANPDKPQVKIYDIGAEPARAPEFYAQAVKDGAQMVVGPLGREAAEQIMRQSSPTVPTLLLSHTDDSGRGKPLFQFGLPPEQEARQVAERAWVDGHRRAAVLYPKDAWGERMLAAFTAHWQRLGGTLAAAQPYQDKLSDYSDQAAAQHSSERGAQGRGRTARRAKAELRAACAPGHRLHLPQRRCPARPAHQAAA